MHEVLVNCLVKLVQEKSVVRETDRPDITIAVGFECHIPFMQFFVLKIEYVGLV